MYLVLLDIWYEINNISNWCPSVELIDSIFFSFFEVWSKIEGILQNPDHITKEVGQIIQHSAQLWLKTTAT